MKQRFACLIGLLILIGTGVARGPAHAAEAQPTPKVTFNLIVSLEWEPGTTDNLQVDLSTAGCSASGADPDYLKDLVTALRRTSAYLYGYSQGQMALGRVIIYTGARGWSTANIRILASNAYRPSALVGGRVATPMTYTSAATGRTQTFYPGNIFLGRLWNGLGARCGAWSRSEGWRTIGHEWAHYALFLYDEYYNQTTQAAQYCTSTGRSLPGIPSTDPQIPVTDSLMAYQYRADQIWLNDAPTPASCAGTPQMYVHGESDWETVPHFYPTVVPPGGLVAGPVFEGSPAATAFVAGVVRPLSPPTVTTARFYLDTLPVPRLVADNYLIRPGTTGSPRRIMRQGQLLPAAVKPHIVWGAMESLMDRPALIVQDSVSGQRWAYPQDYRAAVPVSTSQDNKIVAPASRWRPGMRITPVLTGNSKASEVTGLRVTVCDCTARTKQVQISYCPAGGACTAPAYMSFANGLFTYTFAFPADQVQEPPARFGYIYVRVPTTGEEHVAWYQLAGGVGPAIIDGHAPTVDGQVDVSPAPGASLPPDQDTRLLISSAQWCTLTGRSLPIGVLGIIGSPLMLQPVLTRSQIGGWGPDDPPLRVRLSYDQDLLNQLGIDERNLVLLRLEGTSRWVQVPTAGRSLPLDWIAGAARAFRGSGETYAIGYR